MTLVRVTAHLLHGAAFNPAEAVSLDGPLLSAVMLERHGEAYFTAAPEKAELARLTADPDPDVPFEVYRAGETWIYACSLSEPVGQHGTTLTHWNKRLDDGAAAMLAGDGGLELRRGKVPIGGGQYRSHHHPLWTEVVDRLVWYASSPDPQQLAYLLASHVTHVGKKRAHGNGVVSSWEVEEATDVPADRWLWREPGVPARPIPLAMLEGWTGRIEVRGARPPYWLVQHAESCAVG